MLPSGCPAQPRDMAAVYANIVLAISKHVPILDTDRAADGNIMPSAQKKEGKTSWEVHHDEESVNGPLQPCGRLCFYLDREHKHPMLPTISPGFFVEWHVDTGL